MRHTLLALALLTACKPPATDTTSGASADETAAAAFPILLADAGTAGQYYLYTVSATPGVPIRFCQGVTLEQCKNDTNQPNLTPIQTSGGQAMFASRSFTVKSETPLHLLTQDAAGATKSRSFRLLKSERTITLDLPKEKQVFQRDTVDKGKVVVQVRVDASLGARYLQARVVGHALSNDAKANGGWYETTIGSEETVRLSVPAPAGGWFGVEIALLDETRGRLVGRGVVKEVGVGEVFLVAGQSNSTNCGWTAQRADSDFVVSTDGVKWQRGDDPQIGTHDDHLCNTASGQGGSNWPATGSALVRKYRVPVAFASTGYSGTAVKQWAPGAAAPERDDKGQSLFDYTAKRAEQLQSTGVRAVLWHQGENDAKDATTRADYEAGMTALIRGLRDRTKVDTPWLIAVASWCEVGSYGDEWKGASAEVTAAQAGLVSSRALPELYSGPSTDDLDQQYRGTTAAPKDCHFNDRGLKEVGKRWAEKLETFLDTKLR